MGYLGGPRTGFLVVGLQFAKSHSESGRLAESLTSKGSLSRAKTPGEARSASSAFLVP